MYSQIYCNKECIYQINGRCKCSVTSNRIGKLDENCLFYIAKSKSRDKSTKMFWSDVSRNYFTNI